MNTTKEESLAGRKSAAEGSTSTGEMEKVSGLRRIEHFGSDEMNGLCMELTHAVYPHDEVHGTYCTLREYIDCPPDAVYEYLSNLYSLEEWTWSTRRFSAPDANGVAVGVDLLAPDTRIFCRVESNAEARTVDYHCAWDQGDTLWMIYLMRVIPAETVLNKPGSVVIWTNCRHPYYDENPYPKTAPSTRPVWVGDLWPMFYAGHLVELQNLKAILEHRHARGLDVGPYVAGPDSRAKRSERAA